jgi:hypothetical protein
MLNLFPRATASNPVAVASSSSSSKKNDNDNLLKSSIKDHFNDTKTVRRRGSRTRKQLVTVEPTIDESFADDSTVAVEDDSTFVPSAAGIVATTDDEISQSLMATPTNDKKFNTRKTVAIDESSNTAAAAVPSVPKMHSPNLPLYAKQTASLPPSILRQQTHHPVPVSPMVYNNNNVVNMMPPPPHPAYNYYNCYDYSCNSAGSTRRGGHPDIKNVEVHSSSGSTSLGGGAGGGCDYSYCSGMDSSSYCTTPSLLLTEPCEGFAKLVLRTVDTFASSVVRVMDYGEELCDSSGNNNNAPNSSSSIGTGTSRSTMSNEYVDLLAKIERLQKMVTDKETVFVATEKEENGVMTPSTPNGTSTKQIMLINDLTESPITTMKEEEDETRNNHPTINDTKTMDNPSTINNEDGVAVSSSIPRNSSSSNVPVMQITSSQDWSVMNESLTVLNESIETDLDDFQDVVSDDSKEKNVRGEDDSVVINEFTSSFFNNDTTMTTSNLNSKSMEVDKQNEEESKQQLVNHRSKGSKLKKFFNPKLLVNKGDNNNKYSTLLDDQSAVDSMGFPLDDKFASPLPKSSDNALSSWGSDFNSSSSSYLFRRVSSIGSAESSPVSVATTLESNSCANCGLDGKSVYQSKKKNLMICSQCQSTYYCSSECQSEDWSNGHFKTCQPFAAAAAVNEVLL